MTETIASVALAVNEKLKIQKRRIQNGNSTTRLSLVTGTHGDELEGQYLAFMVGSFIDKNIDLLDGIVDHIVSMDTVVFVLYCTSVVSICRIHTGLFNILAQL